MILVFAEFLDEFRLLEQEGTFLGEDTVLISPSPKVQAAAKKSGITTASLGRYFGRESHERIVLAKQALYAELKTLGGEILDSYGVRDAYRATYFSIIRQFVSHLMSVVELLDNACEELSPEEVRCARLSARSYTDNLEGTVSLARHYHVFRYERYAADIAGRVCEKRGIHFKALQLSIRVPQANWRNSAVTILARALAPVIFRRLAREVGSLEKSGHRKVLFSNPSYRMNEAVRRFLLLRPGWSAFVLENSSARITDLVSFILRGPSRGQDPVSTWFNVLSLATRTSDAKYQQSSGKFFSNLEKALRRREDLWCYRSVNLADFIIERTNKYLRNFMDGIHQSVAALNLVLDSIRPDIIMSQMSLGPTAALGELARRKKLPSLLISHGSHVPMKNVYEEIVWKNHAEQLLTTNYEHVAVQTPWAEKFLEQVPTKSKLYKTGPVLLNGGNGCLPRSKSLRLEFAPNGEKIILHASTPKTRFSPRLYVYETEEEYVANMIDLVEAVKATPGYILIVRFRPSLDLSVKDLQVLLPESAKTRIRADGEFRDYLGAADLVVSFSSTAIEEALLSCKPVIQYDPSGRYCHIPTPPFNPESSRPSAVYFVDRREYLAPMLRWALQNHFPKQSQNWFNDHQFNDKETVDFSQLVDSICEHER